MKERWTYRQWQPGGERRTFADVTFDSTIHCGNGHDFVQIAPGHYRFRARCGMSTYSWRFYMRIDSPGDGRRIVLEVADFNHFGQQLWQERAAVISRDNETWHDLGIENMRIVPWTPTGEAEGDAAMDDGWHPPYGVQYHLQLDTPTLWVASPTPFTLENREAFIRELTGRCRFFTEKAIGWSHYGHLHGYPLRVVQAHKPGGEEKKLRVVVLAGEHPSEYAGMYACEGMMEQVLRSHDMLADFSFWFVPVVNMDGLAHGQSYHNTPPDDPSALGVNVARDWKERSQPETRAVWELIEQVRPHCLVTLHNGKHRTAYEVFCPPQPHLAPLMKHLRAHLPLPLEHWKPYSDDGSIPVVAMKEGVAEAALCFETLILCHLPGCRTFKESYKRAGVHILRGLAAGLREIHGRPSMLALAEPLGTQPQLCRAVDFTAQLPLFYYENEAFDTSREHDTYNFEVNNLPLEPGYYDVFLLTREGFQEMRINGPDRQWRTCRASEGRILICSIPVPGRLLLFDFKHDGGELPFEQVLIAPEGMAPEAALASAVPFERYVRDTLAAEKNHLTDRVAFHAKLMEEGFGAAQLQEMFDEIVNWVAGRQVLDTEDLYHGAVWSEEDKYDARDAAAAAVCFARRFCATGDTAWRDRALAARRYVYRNQVFEPANDERDGGFLHMVHGSWGVDFNRLSPPYPGIDGVDTCVIIHLLCRAAKWGLPLEAADREALRRAACWVAANEPLPGMFLHHEGATHDCQNSNALSLSALQRARHTLAAAGERPPEEWESAVRRGIVHYLDGQEAIGVWPYLFAAAGKRGSRYHFGNIPDHGIGLYHLTRALGEYPLGITFPEDFSAPEHTPPGSSPTGACIADSLLQVRLCEALRRAARWYFCVSYLDGDTINLEYDMKPDLAGDICFSGFTWCRFTAAATLLRIARLTGEPEPWRSLALRLMEHVYRKLRRHDDPSRAPVVAHARPDAVLGTWCQAVEWDAVMLGEMIDDLGCLQERS